MFKNYKVGLASLALAFSGLAVASGAGVPAPSTKLSKPPKVEPLVPYTGPLPAALQSAKGAVELFKRFPAAGGLDGWVAQDKASGKNLIFYTTPDGETLLAGILMDRSGRNLTSEYMEKYVPAPDYSEVLASLRTDAASVMVGSPKAKAELTVMYDANCGYCKVMHRLTQPAVDSGVLKVRYIPVGILSADSTNKGAAILASKNPAATIDASVAGSAEMSNDRAMMAKVSANTNLMKKHGFNGTPVVMYSAKVGGDETVFVSNGVPNITEMFQRLGVDGQLDTLRQDPSLARYVR